MEKQYIDKTALVTEIERLISNGQVKLQESQESNDCESYVAWSEHIATCIKILSIIDTLEVKEVDLSDRKTDWSPSKKQMESLKDMLKYNIGVFDYQKFMEVKSLYDDLIKILDYETDRQK